MKLEIISLDLLEQYKLLVNRDLQGSIATIMDAEISTEKFSYFIAVSSVFSSKIEGEDIELDSYIKHKKFGIEFLPDYTQKTDDLYNAYVFAKTNPLNKSNIEEAHILLSAHLVAKPLQGRNRTQNMFVATTSQPDHRLFQKSSVFPHLHLVLPFGP